MPPQKMGGLKHEKKTLAIILALCLGASMLAACGGSGSSAPASASVAGSTGSSAPEAKPVEIRVVTSYGGDDGNRANYEEAVAGYEAATGNTVVDESATSNEQWKAQVKSRLPDRKRTGRALLLHGY